MKKIRQTLIYGNYFWDFYNGQTDKVKERINWAIRLIEDMPVVPEKYLKHITGTDLYEIRISAGNNIFRIFCFFDKDRLVIVLQGFQKKTQKTPLNEIAKALRLKKQYYENKQEQTGNL